MVMIIIMTEESIFVVTLSKHLLALSPPATSPSDSVSVSEITLTVCCCLVNIDVVTLSDGVSVSTTSVLHWTGDWVMINSPDSLSLISTHTTLYHTLTHCTAVWMDTDLM